MWLILEILRYLPYLLFQAEIEGRHQHFMELKNHGEGLVENHHESASAVSHMLQELDRSWTELNEAWEERKLMLTQCYDMQVYEEYAEQADAWLANKEAFLANEDLGVGAVPELES